MPGGNCPALDRKLLGHLTWCVHLHVAVCAGMLQQYHVKTVPPLQRAHIRFIKFGSPWFGQHHLQCRSMAYYCMSDMKVPRSLHADMIKLCCCSLAAVITMSHEFAQGPHNVCRGHEARLAGTIAPYCCSSSAAGGIEAIVRCVAHM